jgi:hypothetical protein
MVPRNGPEGAPQRGVPPVSLMGLLLFRSGKTSLVKSPLLVLKRTAVSGGLDGLSQLEKAAWDIRM